METPTTQLDESFSEPGSVPTPWSDVLRVLESAEISWISTVRTDDRPHVTPLVSVWLDGAAHFVTGPEEQKALNLEHNPYVILSTGCNQWDDALDVVVEGEAMRVTDVATLERLATAWKTKWDGRWRFEVGDSGFASEEGGPALVFSVEPSKVLAFARGDLFYNTRYLPDDD